MSDKVETMAYAKSGGVPWHGFGNPVSDKMTPKEMQVASGTDWLVEKVPLGYLVDGAWQPLTKDFMLVRNTDMSPLSLVGSVFKPVQNHQIADFMKKFVKAGHMKMETMGSLDSGRYIWCLARVNKDFAIGKGSKADEICSYMLICQPHVRGRAMVFQFTGVRVVCWNTLNYALGANLRGKGDKVFRMSHASAFDDAMIARAEEALGLACEQVDEFKDVVTLLSKKKATAAHVEEFFCEVLKFDPKDAVKKKAKKKDETVREPLMLPKLRLALEHSPGAMLPSAAGTWWGALNAVSYVIDHETGRERDTALRNAWLGNYANVKRRAVDLALARAK